MRGGEIMTEIKKDLEHIDILANQIKKINQKQNLEFSKIRKAINDLQKTWKDNVASHLNESFYKCEKSEKKRNEKMEQIVKLLKDGVISDSLLTEEVNKKLSEKFI